jgi:hypothetical protein
MRAQSSSRVTSFVTERDGVRWRKILHLTGYDVSEAVRTTLALDISTSKYLVIQYLGQNSIRRNTNGKRVLSESPFSIRNDQDCPLCRLKYASVWLRTRPRRRIGEWRYNSTYRLHLLSTYIFRGFLQPLQAKCQGSVPFMPRALPSKSIPIHYPTITQIYDGTNYSLDAVRVENKPLKIRQMHVTSGSPLHTYPLLNVMSIITELLVTSLT